MGLYTYLHPNIHTSHADNVSISMLKSLGVPLNKTEILDDAVGLDEEDIDENMKGNEEILKINDEISIDIYLNLDFDDPHFREYINKKYPQIKFQKI